MIAKGCAAAIALAALFLTTGAMAFSDERMRCASPPGPSMTIYRPVCAESGERLGAPLAVPICATEWRGLEGPDLARCAGRASGRAALLP
jgi:hypothetical protein